MAKRLTLPSLVIVLSVGVIAGAGPRDAGITLEDLVSSDGIATPTLSPGGREFAFTSDGQIKLRASMVGGRLCSPPPEAASWDSTGRPTGSEWHLRARAVSG